MGGTGAEIGVMVWPTWLPQIMGRECHDVDIALDTHTGVQFAQYVNDFLAASGQAVSKIGTIAANPDQSKHLETATVKVLGRFVDFVNLRSERYSGDSRIPVMVGLGHAQSPAWCGPVRLCGLCPCAPVWSCLVGWLCGESGLGRGVPRPAVHICRASRGGNGVC